VKITFALYDTLPSISIYRQTFKRGLWGQ
jgi:hypothetical protein